MHGLWFFSKKTILILVEEKKYSDSKKTLHIELNKYMKSDIFFILRQITHVKLRLLFPNQPNSDGDILPKVATHRLIGRHLRVYKKKMLICKKKTPT
jgi:hypothetical protein